MRLGYWLNRLAARRGNGGFSVSRVGFERGGYSAGVALGGGSGDGWQVRECNH